eukprot:COSAG06_NODE_50746_length_316_cov_1.184332_1_plen_61_part_01
MRPMIILLLHLLVGGVLAAVESNVIPEPRTSDGAGTVPPCLCPAPVHDEASALVLATAALR